MPVAKKDKFHTCGGPRRRPRLGRGRGRRIFLELGKGHVRTLVENVLIPQVGNRHQVEIGQNKSSIFRNNLEILFLELGNSVLKYCF